MGGRIGRAVVLPMTTPTTKGRLHVEDEGGSAAGEAGVEDVALRVVLGGDGESSDVGIGPSLHLIEGELDVELLCGEGADCLGDDLLLESIGVHTADGNGDQALLSPLEILHVVEQPEADGEPEDSLNRSDFSNFYSSKLTRMRVERVDWDMGRRKQPSTSMRQVAGKMTTFFSSKSSLSYSSPRRSSICSSVRFGRVTLWGMARMCSSTRRRSWNIKIALRHIVFRLINPRFVVKRSRQEILC